MQIADRIGDEILQDVYAEESRIPSVREYAVLVEVNVNTVLRSFDYLQNQQIIYNKRGLGYFVCTDAKARVLALKRNYFLQHEWPETARQIKLLGLSLEELSAL